MVDLHKFDLILLIMSYCTDKSTFVYPLAEFRQREQVKFLGKVLGVLEMQFPIAATRTNKTHVKVRKHSPPYKCLSLLCVTSKSRKISPKRRKYGGAQGSMMFLFFSLTCGQEKYKQNLDTKK